MLLLLFSPSKSASRTAKSSKNLFDIIYSPLALKLGGIVCVRASPPKAWWYCVCVRASPLVLSM